MLFSVHTGAVPVRCNTGAGGLPRDARSSPPSLLESSKQQIALLFRAAFSHGPSNSRITEMAHSFVKKFYDGNIPFARLDDMMNFIMEQEYIWRKERREMSGTQSQPTPVGGGIRKRKSVEHLDNKAKQQRSGEQLHESLTKYSAEAIRALPPEVKDKIKVGLIAKETLTKREKKRDRQIIERFEEIKESKAKRKKNAPLDLDDLRRQSVESVTEYDKAWSNRTQQKREELLNSFLKKTYYTGLTGTVDPFNRRSEPKLKREIRTVLPFFWKPELKDVGVTRIKSNKSDESMNLGMHLSKIKESATSRKNLIDDKDLTGMSTLEILEYFIKVDESLNLAEVEREIGEKRKKVVAVLNSFGTKVSDLKRYQPKAVLNESNKEDEEEDDDDNEDDENYLVGTNDVPDMNLGNGFE